jgi:hypothetical protein
MDLVCQLAGWSCFRVQFDCPEGFAVSAPVGMSHHHTMTLLLWQWREFSRLILICQIPYACVCVCVCVCVCNQPFYCLVYILSHFSLFLWKKRY